MNSLEIGDGQYSAPELQGDSDSRSSGSHDENPDSPLSLPHPLDEFVKDGVMNWDGVYEREACETATMAIQCSMKRKEDGDFTFFCDWERPRNAIVQCNILDGWLSGVANIPLVEEDTPEDSFMSYLGLTERKDKQVRWKTRRRLKTNKPPPKSRGIGIQCLLGPRRGYTVKHKSTQVLLPTEPLSPHLNHVNSPSLTKNVEQILMNSRCTLPEVRNSCRGFHGFSSINESQYKDNHLKSLCGINLVHFEELLCQMDRAMCAFAPNREALLFLLMKLKLGLSFTNLGILLGADETALTNLFDEVVQEVHLRCDVDIYWPSKGAIKNCLPPYFKGIYEKTRVILSFLELDTDRPPDEGEKSRLFCSSSEKWCYKVILGWTPFGKVCFKSKPYDGKASFSFIAKDSGFLKLLSHSDVILTDRIRPEMDVFLQFGVQVVSPTEPLNGSVDHINEEVARHVERCLGRLKHLQVLGRVPSSLFIRLDSVVHVCAALINKWPPIIRHDQPDEF